MAAQGSAARRRGQAGRAISAADALNSSSGACASRGVFVAGFAFFELTRAGSLPSGDADGATAATVYVALLTAAFALASVSAAAGIPLRYYLDAVFSEAGRKRFAASAGWLVHGLGAHCLVLALLCYSVALCFVGAAYFPRDDSATIATAAVMAVFALVAVVGLVWVRIASAAAARDAQARGRTGTGESTSTPFDDERERMMRFEPVHVCRMRQADVIADRAAFVVGFAQAGVVRYNAKSPDEEALAVAFLVVVTVACGAALCSSLLATVLCNTVGKLPAQAREQFARQTDRLWGLVPFMFFVSIAAMIVGLGLAGWGANFEAQALLLAWMGLVGVIATASGFWYVTSKAKTAAEKGAAGPKLADAGADDNDQEDWIHHFTLQLRVVGGTGNQAVIAAGFMFMTVVAFQDTVMGRYGATQPWANLFLLANALAAVLALLSTLYATQLQLYLDGLPGARQKAYFARSARPLALFCGWSLECALASFLIGFAVYGTARFTPTRYAPVAMGAAGALGMLLVFIWVHNAFNLAEGTKRTGPAGDDGNRDLFSYPGLASRLDCLGGAGLVLGSFMYLTLHDTIVADEATGGYIAVYNTLVAVASVIAVAAAAWATMTVVRLKSLRADRQKELYTSEVQPVSTLVYATFLLALLAALAGPTIVSLTPAYESRSTTAVCMAVPGPVLLVMALYAMCRAVSVARVAQHDVEEGHAPPTGVSFPPHRRMLRAASPLGMQAAFMAGFCLIEIGHVGLLRGAQWSHATYLALIVATSASSIWSLASVAQLFVWVPHPEDDWARDRVALQLRGGAVPVVAWAFHGVSLAVLLWQCGVVVLGLAKWGDGEDSRYLATLVCGAVGVVGSVVAAIVARVAYKRAGASTLEGRGAPGTPEAAARGGGAVVAMNPISTHSVELELKPTGASRDGGRGKRGNSGAGAAAGSRPTSSGSMKV